MEAILDECHGFPVAKFDPRERLILETEPADAMFVLIEGSVEIARGGVALMQMNAPGSLLGEMSALLGRPYSATVRAVDEVSAYRIDDPGTFLAERPVLLMRTAQLLAMRLDNATAYLSNILADGEGREEFGVVEDVFSALMSRAEQGIKKAG
ncbi:MAG: cyclic nucleotide-binding domain-containing protein [Pseudomonadota bacterium]